MTDQSAGQNQSANQSVGDAVVVRNVPSGFDSTVGRSSCTPSGCSCPGHYFPGVSHMGACCDQSHVDQGVDSIDPALLERLGIDVETVTVFAPGQTNDQAGDQADVGVDAGHGPSHAS